MRGKTNSARRGHQCCHYTMYSSQPGPSRPPRQPSPDLLGSSPDFGDFESAHTNTKSIPASETRSFGRTPLSQQPLIDLLDDEPLPDTPWPPDTSRPLHITLPPRPSEISPDYEPPVRSPRRLSQLSFPGPSSPPQLSEVVFHRAHEYDSPTQTSLGNAQAKLFNTLATTTKIASRWRSTLDHHTFIPPAVGVPERPSDTAVPIDINHTSPFMHLDTPYVPPTGAPGFTPTKGLSRPNGGIEDWSGTKLVGRRAGTSPVLDSSLADSVSPLASNVRLMSVAITSACPTALVRNVGSLMSVLWFHLLLSLTIVSLDQHGASLATLYRLVDAHAANHRSSGNLIIIRDGQNCRFGAYINESIVKREGQYYGGGDR